MKILRITDIGYETGGVESGIILLQPLLEKKGHTIKTLANNDHPELTHFNQYKFGGNSILRKVLYSFNPYSFTALNRAIKEFKPDLVHVHTIGEASASVLYPLRNIPTVLTVHGPEVYSKSLLLWCFPVSNFKHGIREESDLNTIGRLRLFYHKHINDQIFNIGLKNVDKVVTLSSYMHDLMIKDGLNNEYIPNGVKLLDFTPLENQSQSKNLLYVGRLETYKGIDFLIRALPYILVRFPETILTIAGEGSDKSRLQKIVKQLRLEKQVTFLGHTPREKVESLYKSCTLLIVPSAYPEAFGKVGVEAMSVGRPVIATNVGGISDWLVDGKTGILVTPGDSLALANAVITLLSDKELYNHMVFESRKKAEEFDIQAHANKMDAIYKQVLARGKLNRKH